MKQPNVLYSDYIFQGFESAQETFRYNPVVSTHWYVGTCRGTIEACPFVNERHAQLAAEAMANTVGT